jgi:prophage antirepressor-like protein
MSSFTAFNDLGIRVIIADDAPWYLLTDIARALGQAPTGTTIVARSLPAEEVSTTKLLGYPEKRSRTVVSEAGLFRLLLRNSGPAGTHLRDFICQDVLPSLRKSGRFVLPTQNKTLLKAHSRRSSAVWDTAAIEPAALLGLIRTDTASVVAREAART